MANYEKINIRGVDFLNVNLDEAAEVIGNDEINLYTSWSKAPATYTKTDVACTGSVLGHTMANATCMSDKVCDACGITYAGPAGHSYQNTPTTATLVSLATSGFQPLVIITIKNFD